MASPSSIVGRQIQCFPANLSTITCSLWDWYSNMSTSEQTEFSSYFSDLPSALKIVPHEGLIRSLLYFWDSSASVFRIGGDNELTPVIEEYVRLLNLKQNNKDLALPPFAHNFKRRLSEFVHMKKNEVEQYINVEQGTCSITFLINRFGTPAELNPRQLRCRPWVLALCLTSTLLFPRADGNVDLRLMYVMDDVGYQKGIVPMILAETYRALTQCSAGQSVFFSGAAILLQIWALAHLCGIGKVVSDCWFSYDLIAQSQERYGDMDAFQDEGKWVACLNKCSWKNIRWFLGWASNHSAVLDSGNYPFLPLIGLNGVVPYAPNRVLRQFGWLQIIPRVGDMTLFSFDYTADPDRSHLKVAIEAWQSSGRYDSSEQERETLNNGVVADYDNWLSSHLAGEAAMTATSLMGYPAPPATEYKDYITTLLTKTKRLTAAYVRDQERTSEEADLLKAEVISLKTEISNVTAKLNNAEALIRYVWDTLHIAREAGRENVASSLKSYRIGVKEVLKTIQEYPPPSP